MGITTDKIMDALATELNCRIVRKIGEIYTFKGALEFRINADSKTGIITTNPLQEGMQERFEKVVQQLWKEYMGL